MLDTLLKDVPLLDAGTADSSTYKESSLTQQFISGSELIFDTDRCQKEDSQERKCLAALLTDFFNTPAFRGLVYVNNEKRQVMLAIRGSAELKDWLGTDLQILLAIPCKEELVAKKFTQKLRELYPNYNFIFTGHSKGGYIAKALTLEYGGLAIAFDAPSISRRFGIADPFKLTNIISIHSQGSPVGCVTDGIVLHVDVNKVINNSWARTFMTGIEAIYGLIPAFTHTEAIFGPMFQHIFTMLKKYIT